LHKEVDQFWIVSVPAGLQQVLTQSLKAVGLARRLLQVGACKEEYSAGHRGTAPWLGRFFKKQDVRAGFCRGEGRAMAGNSGA
jgi:hypothetical protein